MDGYSIRQALPKSICVIRDRILSQKKCSDMVNDSKVQSTVAIGSFLAAVAFAFTALLIRQNHEILAGDLMMVAQFLMLTATIFGLDYKITSKISQVLRKEKER